MPSRFNVHAGRLAEYVDIQQLTTTYDSLGHDSDTWAALHSSVAAEVTPETGNEFTGARETQADVTHIVRIRYRSGITPKMRLSYRSRTLEILAVYDRGERRRMLELHCKEMAT